MLGKIPGIKKKGFHEAHLFRVFEDWDTEKFRQFHSKALQHRGCHLLRVFGGS